MKSKILSKVILAALCGFSFTYGASEARIVTNCVPMLTYANATVSTYDKPGGDQKGFISPNVALIMIKELRKDGWAYGSYPIAGGKRIYRWFRMADVQGFSNFENYVISLDSDMTVYRGITGDAKIGTLPAKVEALVVGESGNNLKIIYKVSGGNEYKMGWVTQPSNNEDTGGTGGVNSPLPGNFKGNIIVVQGDVVNSGSIDASVKDKSVTDNSYRDNSKHSTTINEDNSYTDNSKTTNVKITDNSKNTNISKTSNDTHITNVDSFNNASINSDNPNIEKTSPKKIRGDLNGDGKVNFDDLLLLARNLAGKSQISAQKADINRDGQINRIDFDALLKIVKQQGNACGDLNNDGKIDAKDLALMERYVKENRAASSVKAADLNGQGQSINKDDLEKLQELITLLKQRTSQ